MEEEVVELLVAGRLGDVQVVVQLGLLDELPDLPADGRQLGRVHRLHLGVLVEQLLELRHLVVRVGARHRRHEVVDDGRVRPALGLRPLARVVDDERVEQRQVAEHRVRRAAGRQAEALAGQPLERPVLAEVDDGVRAEAALLDRRRQPAVRREVVVRRRQVGVVVDRDGVLAEAARRLDGEHDVAVLQCCQHDLVAVDVERPGRGAPVLDHRLLQRDGQRREPGAVVGERHARDRRAQLVLGEPLDVVAAGGDERVDELVPVLRELADVVARRAHGLQQQDGGGRGVEADRVADAGVLGRVRRQHQRDPLVGVRDGAQPGVADGDAGDAGRALGVGDVDRHAVLAGLLERERHGDEPPVELRDRHLHRRVDRRGAGVGGVPVAAAARQAQRLQHRHVEAGQRGGVPALGVAGVRAAARQHGDDERVDVGEQLVDDRQPAVAVGPQGADEHGPGVRARRPRRRRTGRRRTRCCPTARGPGRRRRRRSAARRRPGGRRAGRTPAAPWAR